MPLTDATLAKNIESTLRDVSTLLNDASKVNARAKTVYYKAVILSLASVVEAQAHHFLERRCVADITLYQKDLKSYKPKIPLSRLILGTSNQFYVAEEINTTRTFKNISGSFKSIIEFCKEKALLPVPLIEELDYIRKKRNTIHLQTLDTTTRSYTLIMVSRIADTMIKMYDEIDKC
jgi:hypothetical protein